MFLWRESIEKIIEHRVKGNTIKGIAREAIWGVGCDAAEREKIEQRFRDAIG